MKTNRSFFAAFVVALGVLSLTCACNGPQAAASGAYIAAEAATAQLITKNPALVPVAQALVVDWNKFQGGKLTAQDEAALLQQIVAATKGKLSPAQAAALDGAVQQILANQNATAPTPLQGAAGAIITTVMNGVARELVINGTPAPSA